MTDLINSSPRTPLVSTFHFEDKDVRVIWSGPADDLEPLFCLSDVCAAMALTTPAKVANQVKEEFKLGELNSYSFDSGFGIKGFTMITEPQLYFVMMRGRSKVAHNFRQWICNEVVPTIRKKGRYSFADRTPEQLTEVKEPQPVDQNITSMTHSQLADLLISRNNLQPRDQVILGEIIRKAKGYGWHVGSNSAAPTPAVTEMKNMADDIEFLKSTCQQLQLHINWLQNELMTQRDVTEAVRKDLETEREGFQTFLRTEYYELKSFATDRACQVDYVKEDLNSLKIKVDYVWRGDAVRDGELRELKNIVQDHSADISMLDVRTSGLVALSQKSAEDVDKASPLYDVKEEETNKEDKDEEEEMNDR